MASSGSHNGLPARYEIRRLGPEHMVWAKAIVLHANLFQSPVWKELHAGELTEKLMAGLSPSVDYLFTHQVNSGLSWGIFDTEYVFKNPASATRGGALYWDPKDTSSTGEQLLEQMDFPLASVALAYDGINRLDYALLGPLLELLPAYSTIMDALGTLDKRDPKSWEATAPNQVLMRNATATRADYANNGQRLMKHLAHFLMRDAKRQGFRGIQIECLHDAVIKIWLQALPSEGMTGQLISDIPSIGEWEEIVDGKTRKPFAPLTQRVTKIYVTI